MSAAPSTSVTANVDADAYVYLHTRPALAFLKTIILVGADVVVAPHEYLDLSFNSATVPPYCAAFTSKLHGTVSGFLKTLFFPELTTPTAGGETVISTVSSGACGDPTNASSAVQLSLDPSTPNPLPFWAPAQIDAKVTGTPPANSSNTTPSGMVSVVFGGGGPGAACTVTLDAAGQGRCIVTATNTGTGIQVSGTYSGDGTFPPSTGTTSVDVNQTPSAVSAITAIPTPLVAGAAITLSATVSAVSPVTGEPTPMGDVEFFDADTNLVLCEQSIASVSATGGGQSSCSAFVPSGVTSITVAADYGGDVNFLPSSNQTTFVVSPNKFTDTVRLTTNPQQLPSEGGSVTFTVTVTPGTDAPQSVGAPTGIVTVLDETSGMSTAITLCTINLSTANSCTATDSGSGTLIIAASYAGDEHFAPGTTTAFITIAPSQTTYSYTGNPFDVAYCESVIYPLPGECFGGNVIATVTFGNLPVNFTGTVSGDYYDNFLGNPYVVSFTISAATLNISITNNDAPSGGTCPVADHFTFVAGVITNWAFGAVAALPPNSDCTATPSKGVSSSSVGDKASINFGNGAVNFYEFTTNYSDGGSGGTWIKN